MHQQSRRRTRALALLATVAALAGVSVGEARAQKSPLRTCTDNAWSNYNACLMETDSSFFRTGCDFDFAFSYEACYIKFGRETFGG